MRFQQLGKDFIIIISKQVLFMLTFTSGATWNLISWSDGTTSKIIFLGSELLPFHWKGKPEKYMKATSFEINIKWSVRHCLREILFFDKRAWPNVELRKILLNYGWFLLIEMWTVSVWFIFLLSWIFPHVSLIFVQISDISQIDFSNVLS